MQVQEERIWEREVQHLVIKEITYLTFGEILPVTKLVIRVKVTLHLQRLVSGTWTTVTTLRYKSSI